jgi:hypothetical protein
MPAQVLLEYDATDVDARINAGVAVLVMTTDQGRVAVSMAPDVLELLALRIQLEFARAQTPPRRSAYG